MGVRQPPKKATSRAAGVDQHKRTVEQYRKKFGPLPKKKQSVPWWGWCIVGFLVLKGCGAAAQYTGHETPATVTVPATATQGGQ